jgi:hypothetical protein
LKESKFCELTHEANSIAEIASKISLFLNLPDPTEYTGHFFRRIATKNLPYEGITLTTFKRFRRWKLDSVAQDHVDKDLSQNKDIALHLKIVNPKVLPENSSKL